MNEKLDDLWLGLRVGVDMDGVLTDFNRGWIERYNEDFDVDLQVDQVIRWEGLHRLTHFETMDDFWVWARGDGRPIFRDLPPFPDAVETARRMSERHRLIIVSSKFDWAIPDSLAWLADHRIAAREVHFLWRKSLADCDVYLEDAPHQLEELVEERSEATICRMVRPWNEPVAGTRDVDSWPEFEVLVDRLARGEPALEAP